MRKICILCENDTFTDCFDIVNTINIVETADVPYNDDEIKILKFVGCINCGCVQLQNLFDPRLIYDQKSHYTESNVWIKHNECLVNFIEKNSFFKKGDVIEIGGGGGKLAKNILHQMPNLKSYKILDISIQHIERNKDIEYIEGNCEEYDFKNATVDTIIMSHVFEHLYEPRKFLKNITNSKIEEVFISIPDMENLTKNGDINNLHIQHTFYIDTNFISWLFREYNFELKNVFNYDNNSVFYHFVKNATLKKKTIGDVKNVQIIETLKNFYLTVKENIKKINFIEPFFICPSGFYGKIIYHYLENNTKKNIIGFLDSDKSKINSRLSGTNSLIFDKEYIKSYKNVNVLLIAEKYNKEIAEELLSYNNSIKFNFFFL